VTAPGPLGDEARALVEAARDWAARTFPESHSAECSWCPGCRAVAALRSPGTADRIAGAVTAAAGALAAVLESLTAPPSAPAPAPGATDRVPRAYDVPVDGDA
jgi:hypothetical protein